MKYFSLPKNGVSKGPQMSVWIISRSFVLLVAPFLVCLVCLPLIQSTNTPRSVKSRFERISSFTNLSNLSLEMCPYHLCHKFEEFSLIRLRLVPILWCKVRRVSANWSLSLNLYKRSQRIPELTKEVFLNKLKLLFPKFMK